MKSRRNYLITRLAIALACLIILGAGVLATLHMITPAVGRYFLDQRQQEITHYLAERNIRVGTIETSWQGLGPVIILHDVEWQPKDLPTVVQINLMNLRFNLIKGLLTKQWLPYAIRINGGNIDGPKIINYLQANTDNSQATSADVLVILHQLSRIQWKEVHLTLPHHEQLISVETSGRIKSADERHRFELMLQRAEQPLSVLEVTADIDGPLQDWRNSSGTAYVAWYDTDIASILAPYQWKDIALQAGSGEINSWFAWKQGKISRVQSVIDAKEIHLTTENKARQLAGNIAGHFLWQAEPNNDWILSADNLRLQLADKEMPTTEFKLKKSTLDDSGLTQYEFTASKIQLPLINQIADLGQQSFAKQLAQFTFDGTLHQPAISITLDEKTTEIKRYAVRSRFVGLGVFAHDFPELPHIQGADGEVSLTEQKGIAAIYSNSMQIGYDHWGLEPIEIHQLRSHLEWQKNQDDWLIRLSDIGITTPDTQLYGNVQLTIPPDHNIAVDTELSLSRLNINAVNRYLPTTLLSPGLSTWLKTALQGGEIKKGKMVLQGNLNDFPFTKDNGKFLVELLIANGKLKYDPAWPVAEAIEGKLTFTGNSMLGQVDSARIYDVKIGPTTVDIPVISNEITEHLILKGQAHGDLSSALKYIQNSPLKKMIASSMQSTVAKGAAQLDLEFDLPLSEQQPLSYLKGLLTTKNSSIYFPEWNLHFNKINGALHISEKGIAADRIDTVSSFAGPVIIDIKTISPSNKQPGYLEVNGKGHVSIIELAKFYSSLNWSYFSGSTDFAFKLQHIEGVEGKDNLLITSNLKGIGSTLPEFLTKSPDTAIDFSVGLNWPTPTTAEYHVKYDKQIESQLAFQIVDNKLTFNRGVVAFNEPIAANWRDKPGLLVSGKIKSISDLSTLAESFNNKSDQNPKTDFASKVREVQLFIENLSMDGFLANHATLSLVPKGNTWQINIKSNETVGNITLVPGSTTTPVLIDLSKCHFLPSDNKLPKKVNPLKPTDLPVINFSCKAFNFNNRLLGQVELQTKKIASGLEIDKFTITNPHSQLTVNGQWTAVDNAQSTSLKGTVNTKNFGDTLRRLDVQTEIGDGEGAVTFDLNITDSLLNLSADKLNGQLIVDLKNGRINQVTSTVGHVLNIFSLDNLQKRLSLDFRGIFSSGFAFSHLQGQFDIQKGVVTTNNFSIKGSSADLFIVGQTNMVSEQLNMEVMVTPHVTGSLPLAVGIATANPFIGVAVWAADKVLGSHLDKITQYKYHVTGSWDKPDVKLKSES